MCMYAEMVFHAKMAIVFRFGFLFLKYSNQMFDHIQCVQHLLNISVLLNWYWVAMNLQHHGKIIYILLSYNLMWWKRQTTINRTSSIHKQMAFLMNLWMKIIKQISQTCDSWHEWICLTNDWISESSSWLTHWILMIHWISQKSSRLTHWISLIIQWTSRSVFFLLTQAYQSTHWICHSSLDLFIQSFLSSFKYYVILS